MTKTIDSKHRGKKDICLMLGLICLLPAIIVVANAGDYYINYLNLREELSAKIKESNVISGRVQAYLPDNLYKKYRLRFVTSNEIVTEKRFIPKGTNGLIRDHYENDYYYFIKRVNALTTEEKAILDKDVNFVKYVDLDGNIYFLAFPGGNSGSANFDEFTIRLYKFLNGQYSLIFNTKDIYSVDPGIDSHFFLEHLDAYLLRTLARDDRY